MKNSLSTLLFTGALIFASTAQAGAIYTDEALFLAATSSLTTAWSEDFESYDHLSSVPLPLAIGGGSAEVVGIGNAGFTSATDGTASGFALGVFGDAATHVTLRGIGDTALGLGALSFEFAPQFDGQWDFQTNLGVQSSMIWGAANTNQRIFLGWVGEAGESLTNMVFSADGGMILDTINAYAPSSVPEPGILLLLSLSLLGMGLTRMKNHS